MQVERLFRGRQVVATLLVLLAAGVMVWLGVWQWSRLGQRRALNALIAERMDAPPLALRSVSLNVDALTYRRVLLTGIWDSAHEMVLRNQSRHGQPGVHLLTPLLLSGTQGAVLVDRGWIPYNEASPEARQAYAEPAPATVGGIVRASQPHDGWPSPVDLPASGADRVDAWFRVDLLAIQHQLPYPLAPIWVVQTDPAASAHLPARSDPPALEDGPHLSYALQWWSFAIILLVGYGALVLRPSSPAIRAPSPRPDETPARRP